MTSQPGWHPDPVPPPPGHPAQLRYWDGTRWTEHVAPAQPPAPGQGYAALPAYGAASVYAGGPATTPDGVPLAGWWQRVLAWFVDWLVVAFVAGIAAYPWATDIIDSYGDWLDTVNVDDSNSYDTSQLQSDLAGPIAIVALISLGVGLVYHVAFLMWKQATPGKLAVGLRVRLRERPGAMPVGTVLLRWAGQFGVGLLGMLPVLGCLYLVYRLLDYLWPLWDDKLQAIHDKIAKTNVVRVR